MLRTVNKKDNNNVFGLIKMMFYEFEIGTHNWIDKNLSFIKRDMKYVFSNILLWYFCYFFFVVFVHSALNLIVLLCERVMLMYAYTPHTTTAHNKNGERFGLFLFAHLNACMCVFCYVWTLAYMYVPHIFHQNFENWTYFLLLFCAFCVCARVCACVCVWLSTFVVISMEVCALI